MNANPDFTFNEKTGELQRGGKLIALCRLHAEMFACLAEAQTPIGSTGIAKAINMPRHAVEYEMPRLAARLKRVGIRIATVAATPRGKSARWLQFEDVPKWEPKIAPPVVLEGR